MSSANRAVIVVRRPPRVVALVKADVKNPGSRGGVFRRSKTGKVAYGAGSSEPRRVRSIAPGMEGLIARKEQELRSGKTLTDEGIPRMWMVGAVQRNQREGMGPKEAHVAAIRHWHEQERLEEQHRREGPAQDRYGRPLDPNESMADRMKRESTGDSPDDRERRSKLKPASPPKEKPARLSYQDLGLAPGLSRTYGVLRPGGEAAGSTDSIAAAHEAAAKIGGEVMVARGPDAGRMVRHDEGRSLGVKTRKDFPSGGDARGGQR